MLHQSSSKRPLIIVHIDDDYLARDLVAKTIAENPAYCLYQFENGEDFLKARTSLPPIGILLLELHMGQMHGREVLRRLEERGVQIPAIILSRDPLLSDYVNEYKFLGVKGFIPKKEYLTITPAFETVRTGMPYANSTMIEGVLKEGRPQNTNELLGCWSRLSRGERLCAVLTAAYPEACYKQIAHLMRIRPNGVRTFQYRAYEKLCVKTKASFVLRLRDLWDMNALAAEHRSLLMKTEWGRKVDVTAISLPLRHSGQSSPKDN